MDHNLKWSNLGLKRTVDRVLFNSRDDLQQNVWKWNERLFASDHRETITYFSNSFSLSLSFSLSPSLSVSKIDMLFPINSFVLFLKVPLEVEVDLVAAQSSSKSI